MAIDTSHGQTVLLEESDDRLATAEESKRSGEPLRSVGANATVPVPASTAINVAENHLKDDVYVGNLGQTFPKHLEEIHDARNGPDGNHYVALTNEEKAAQHEAYSANLIRERQKESEETQKKIDEGYDIATAIVESNLRRAEEHESAVRDWKIAHDKQAASQKSALEVTDAVIDQTKDLDVIDDAKISFKGVNKAPDASESSIKQGLKIKDQLISAQRNFKDSASNPAVSLNYDHPAVAVLNEADSPEGLQEIHADHLAARREAYGEVDGATTEAERRKEDYISSVDTESGKEAAEDGKPTNTEAKNAKSVASAVAKAEANKDARAEDQTNTTAKSTVEQSGPSQVTEPIAPEKV